MNAVTPSEKSWVRKQRKQLQEHVMDVLLERLGFGGAHHPLDRANRQRRVGGDLVGQCRGSLRELLGSEHLVHEAEFVCFVRSERSAGERDLGSLGVADHPRQQPGPTALGHDPPLGEARVEFGGVDRCPDVAAERQVEAVAGRSSIEGADRRRVEVVEHDRWCAAEIELAAERRVATAEVPEPALRTRHLRLQVEAGAERPAGAGEHDAAHVRIVIGAQQQLADLLAASAPKSCSCARERSR